jgi:ADP-glucose pyrophosphorylase
VTDSILWAGSRVESGAVVEGSVVREGMIAAGEVKATVV